MKYTKIRVAFKEFKGATKDKYGNYPSLVVSIYTPKAADALK